MAADPEAAMGCQFVSAWARFWCLHQLAPFANVALGVSGGAIDNWPLQGPLNWWHWHVRLPVVLATLAWPSPRVATAAHACNLAFFAMAMPFVWDHMAWAALNEICFVLAMLAARLEPSPQAFVAAARTQTIVSYCCAAFWKLTTSFLDPRYSCGTLLTAELLSILPGSLFTPGGEAARLILEYAGWLTISGEFAIPLTLAVLPRAGVALGLAFHLTVLLLPVNAAGGFSLSCARAYVVFVPRGIVLAMDLLAKSTVGAGAVAAVVAVAFAALGGTADAYFGMFLLFAVLLVYAASCERSRGAVEGPASSAGWLWHLLAALLALLHGIAGPILGVQQMASLTMYGNVQHWGRSNHLLAPTGVLQDWFTDMPADVPFFGAFAGGAVRVDSSDLPAELLRTPADASGLESASVHRLLADVGNPGKFYVPYYARMAGSDFFDDAVQGNASAVEAGMSWRWQPFAVPALELRRMLTLARARGRPFWLHYTPLPHEARTPGQWTRYSGPQVRVQERPEEGRVTCERDGVGACGPTELAMLPPPPRWLSKILLQYPVPLSEGLDVELPCIS